MSVFEPRPIRKLTIWIGGNSKAAMRRATTLGDAWHPNVFPLETFKKLVSEFRKIPNGEVTPICVRIGLDTKAKSSIYTGPRGDLRLILAADMAENANTVSELEKLGVTYAVVATNADGKVSIPDQVESLRAFAKTFIKQ